MLTLKLDLAVDIDKQILILRKIADFLEELRRLTSGNPPPVSNFDELIEKSRSHSTPLADPKPRKKKYRGPELAMDGKQRARRIDKQRRMVRQIGMHGPTACSVMANVIGCHATSMGYLRNHEWFDTESRGSEKLITLTSEGHAEWRRQREEDAAREGREMDDLS